jgi:hypothetical protein
MASEKDVRLMIEEIERLLKKYGGWMKAKETFTKNAKVDTIELTISLKVM